MTSIEELSLDGFKIVKSEMFLHLPRKSEPTCTLWPTCISFSKMALQLLNCCEFIRMEVNPTSKSLLVVPTTSSDKNSMRWIKGTKELGVRKFESKVFGDELYKAWDLDPEYNYRANGRLVSARKKVMLLFEFSNAEMWKTKSGVQKNV